MRRVGRTTAGRSASATGKINITTATMRLVDDRYGRRHGAASGQAFNRMTPAADVVDDSQAGSVQAWWRSTTNVLAQINHGAGRSFNGGQPVEHGDTLKLDVQTKRQVDLSIHGCEFNSAGPGFETWTLGHRLPGQRSPTRRCLAKLGPARCVGSFDPRVRTSRSCRFVEDLKS